VLFKLDPLFSVKKNYRPTRLLRMCFSLFRVLLSWAKLIKQWLLFYKMPNVHEYWFYIRHCWVILHNKGLSEDFLVLFLFLSEGLISVFKSNFWEGCLNKVLWVSSLNKMCFEVPHVLFKYCLCLVLSSLRASFVMDGRLKNGCNEMFSGCVHLALTRF